MYIQKQEFRPGFNDYLRSDAGVGREINMDVQLLILERDDTIRIEEPEKEMAILLFEGTADAALDGQTRRISRQDTFRDGAWCIHICAGTPVVLQAREHCELYIQKTANERTFPSRIYGPDDVQTVEAGNNGELDGTMRRYIRTFFDYSNAPYSNMVLGEVQNFPGRWSSYPPHHHPQPEVYFYRFDKPQGFGAGFANGEIYKTGHNGLLVIQSQFHSQVCAPGYPLIYAWGIRHLPGDPWDKTRIDDEEHTWLLGCTDGMYRK